MKQHGHWFSGAGSAGLAGSALQRLSLSLSRVKTGSNIANLSFENRLGCKSSTHTEATALNTTDRNVEVIVISILIVIEINN